MNNQDCYKLIQEIEQLSRTQHGVQPGQTNWYRPIALWLQDITPHYLDIPTPCDEYATSKLCFIRDYWRAKRALSTLSKHKPYALQCLLYEFQHPEESD